MLGQSISDPSEIESAGTVQGLGLLPIDTIMQSSKVTVADAGRLLPGWLFGQPIKDTALRGYEIHVGETSYIGSAKAFTQVVRKSIERTETVDDGCISADSRIFGTYLHGLFDGDAFRHAFVKAARAFCRLAPPTGLNDWESRRQKSLDRLADTVRQSLDMAKVFGWVGLRYQTWPDRETSEAAR